MHKFLRIWANQIGGRGGGGREGVSWGEVCARKRRERAGRGPSSKVDSVGLETANHRCRVIRTEED